ncbi:MAG: flavodoxin family protein [Myxococcota bacterium]
MKTALILSGVNEEHAHAKNVESEVAVDLERRGYEVRTLRLPQLHLAPCTGCFECWTENPGQCKLRDDGNKLIAAVIASDIVVLSGPVSFGGYCSELKKGIDRLLPLVSPFFRSINGETHHIRRYRRYPAFLGVGLQTVPDSEEAVIFRELVRRTGIDLKANRAASCVVGLDQPAVPIRTAIDQLTMGAS